MPSILLPVKPVGLGAPLVRRLPDGTLEEPAERRLDPVNETTVAWAVDAIAGGAAERVTAVAIGGSAAETALRAAAARGCERLLRIELDRDAGLAPSALDVATVAALLAAAARHVGADLVALGCESLDGSSGVVPAATAAALGWPLASRARTASLGAATGEARSTEEWRSDHAERGQTSAPPAGSLAARGDDDGEETVPLPAVVSFAEGGVTVRAPRLAHVIAARSAAIETVTAAQLLGDRAPATWSGGIVGVEPVPPRTRATRTVPAADPAAGARELLAAIEAVRATGAAANGDRATAPAANGDRTPRPAANGDRATAPAATARLAAHEAVR
ncbi:electron transfer flavoprotein alpha/beta- subunit [Conexibacter woesei]|uniref:Electron transfer flavoprotein alpha/beta-subunit n=1 Tax=Conexibacter woesei (strain DSM 14684 / CCUG 47730 / CIP 108061 / JCM 11494 / NBRC 100937 / ID131577) TaxID=469383 RepID=D3FF39_CONWI|nr:electron transfer flavoprotein alpha/beta- subunit [Conexibacter woesei]ADB51756.1 Electron transfer flavoprotein alpha/beta- subunit [Conexibacter woesei DSM 14684]